MKHKKPRDKGVTSKFYLIRGTGKAVLLPNDCEAGSWNPPFDEVKDRLSGKPHRRPRRPPPEDRG